MTELMPFTLSATIKNRYIELRCTVEALTQEEAIEKLQAFLVEVQMYHDGEVIVMGQR
jgi:23S rRNA C2498 (ribose-2'-O)-methylase RlmM